MPRCFVVIGAALVVILAIAIEIAAFAVSPRSSAIVGAVIGGSAGPRSLRAASEFNHDR